MKKQSTIFIIAITFIWSGMLCGISFLEAPLKFQAPGITLELGLGIGKLVFGALTKIEMGFSLLLVSLLLYRKSAMNVWLLFFIPILIVVIDNAVLLPILDARIDLITSGVTPPRSNAHWWYVGLEFIKLIALIIGGSTFLNRSLTKNNI